MANDQPTRIAVVDDHPLFREGVAQTLDAQDGLEVVGQADSAEAAIRLVETLAPDVLLLDLTLPGGGLAVLRAIAGRPTHVMVLTASEDDDDLLAALEAGARGYVLKGVGADELMRIVRLVAAGEVYVPPSMAAVLLIGVARGSRAAAPTSPLDALSERERQVLELLAQGQSNREIGDGLHLTEKTVKHYVTAILQKLNVRNRVEAALQAREILAL